MNEFLRVNLKRNSNMLLPETNIWRLNYIIVTQITSKFNDIKKSLELLTNIWSV